MAQQTAVEFLMIKLFGRKFRNTVTDQTLNAFQAALKVEKQNVMKAYVDKNKSAEEYIKETYNYHE